MSDDTASEDWNDGRNIEDAYYLGKQHGRAEAEAEIGRMHAVDRAFYDLTVKQRDAAWREIEALKAAWTAHDCVDKFATVELPVGQEVTVKFLEGQEHRAVLVIPVSVP